LFLLVLIDVGAMTWMTLETGKPVTLLEARIVRALNCDLSPVFAGSKHEDLARTLCHIGQPVGVRFGAGMPAGTLRISYDARIAYESWRDGGEQAWQEKLENRCHQISTVLEKVQLITTRFDSVARYIG